MAVEACRCLPEEWLVVQETQHKAAANKEEDKIQELHNNKIQEQQCKETREEVVSREVPRNKTLGLPLNKIQGLLEAELKDKTQELLLNKIQELLEAVLKGKTQGLPEEELKNKIQELPEEEPKRKTQELLQQSKIQELEEVLTHVVPQLQNQNQ